MMKIVITLFTLSVLFLSSCETTKEDKYKDSQIPQSSQNRSSWDKVRRRFEKDYDERRARRTDVKSMRNDKFQVFPGRNSGRRSEELYENDKSVFSLW